MEIEGKIQKNIKIEDIWRIQNKRLKTYKKIWAFLCDMKLKLERGEQTEDITMKQIYKEYNIEPRTQTRYFKEYLHKLGRKKILLLTQNDILAFNEVIQIFKQFKSLPDRQQKLIKYIIYFLKD